MTLEPVHIQEIARMAELIERAVEDEPVQSPQDLFQRLSELNHNGKILLQSIGFPARFEISAHSLILSIKEPGFSDPYSVVYACDSGSTNPMQFDCGLFVDICHCAMASTPSDLNLHRRRTIVCAGFSSSRSSSIIKSEAWRSFDDGYGRSTSITIDTSILKKRIARMVHDIALYLAESEHILWLQKNFDTSGFLIMDGPIYPKQLMYWTVVSSDDIRISHDPTARRILQNYVDIMDFHIDSKIPVIGYVKNPGDIQIVNALKEQLLKEHIYMEIPWSTDAQLFKSLLRPNPNSDSSRSRFLNESDRICYTNWFVQPNQFYEETLQKTSPLAGVSLNHGHNPDMYALSFFIIFRIIKGREIIFKIEAPYGLIQDEDVRRSVTQKVLYELSFSDIPESLYKADTIAKIRIPEKNTVRSMFGNLKIDTDYNSIRWSDLDEL